MRSAAFCCWHTDDLWRDKLPKIGIIVTVTSNAQSRVRLLIDRLRYLPNRVVLLLDLDEFNPQGASLAQVAHTPAAYVSGAPEDARRATVKRISDIVFASLMLLAFAPLMAMIALAIKLDSKGPALFKQKRHGFNNETIRVWKFRSMRPDQKAEDGIITQVTSDDDRVTKVGRFLRRTSLDELPQLINVLMGEMSLVGPRPHAVGMTTEATEVHKLVSDYAHRHRVKPGLTGWAQINGSRGPVHTAEEVRERVRLDMEYVNRSSFWFDLYIMIMTAPVWEIPAMIAERLTAGAPSHVAEPEALPGERVVCNENWQQIAAPSLSVLVPNYRDRPAKSEALSDCIAADQIGRHL